MTTLEEEKWFGMIFFYVYNFWISYCAQKHCFEVLSSMLILQRLKKLKIIMLEEWHTS